jgi:ribonuclease HI
MKALKSNTSASTPECPPPEPDLQGTPSQSLYRDHRSSMAHVDAAEDLPDHHLILYADAAVRYEAPQCAAWAWMATDDERHELAHACGIVGCASWHTSNRAEFEAVIQALSWAAQHAHGWRVECRNDAANVIDLLHTETYEGRLQAFHQRGRALAQALDAAIVWVPRTD